MIGSPEIEILEIEISNYSLGKIIRIKTNVENLWNKKFNVIGKIDVFKQDSKIDTVEIFSKQIDIYSEDFLEAFLDTLDFQPGIYKFKIELNYHDLVSKKEFEINFKQDKYDIAKKRINLNRILLIAMLVVIAFMIAFEFILKKRD
jgi:hypothetical protein